MNKTIIYSTHEIQLYIDNIKNILYVEVMEGTYNKKNFLEAVEYYKNFWLLINNTDYKYHQVFIFNNIKFYPLEFYDIVFNILKNLENIFKKNLYSSCLVNDSNALDILRPLLNMYKAVKPFSFVRTLDEGYEFLNKNT
jgi:hypothetical protein